MPLSFSTCRGCDSKDHGTGSPSVHATTRTPGPSTAEPVVNEWRNPSRRFRWANGVGLTDFLARETRRSYGLASNGTSAPLLRDHMHQMPPWKVRLITSICCSRVSRTKLTA